MQVSADSVWSGSPHSNRRFQPECSPVQDALEIHTGHFRLRGLAWSILLSIVLWGSFLLAGRAFWNWRW